jgi:hypothetical protein
VAKKRERPDVLFQICGDAEKCWESLTHHLPKRGLFCFVFVKQHLAIYITQLTLNTISSCTRLLSAGITDMCHHTWLSFVVFSTSATNLK